jgi:hypothetical protein
MKRREKHWNFQTLSEGKFNFPWQISALDHLTPLQKKHHKKNDLMKVSQLSEGKWKSD